MSDDDDDIFHRGLAFDLGTVLNRRRLLGLIGGAGAATLVGCSPSQPGSGNQADAPTMSPSTGTSPTTGTLTRIPEETAGPYPGDGSNGPDALTQSGIVRGDIRSSFGSASRVAPGVPLTINLTIVDTTKSFSGFAGAATTMAAAILSHRSMVGREVREFTGVASPCQCTRLFLVPFGRPRTRRGGGQAPQVTAQ